MELVWYAIVTAMLAVYVVLDGFDFGTGILLRWVARTEEERLTALSAIEPVWDGNEVWLIAGGGLLFLSFPRTYASAFSGYYLALMIVLWLLILRGIAVGFRSHQANPLWREFWDTTLTIASGLIAVVLGAALGNVIRGVPLDETGYFSLPLFTNFRPGRYPGILDWYTTLVGIFTLCAIAGHGAFYLAWKTAGPVQMRSRGWARNTWLAVIPLWLLVTLATAWVQPGTFRNLIARPWALGFLVPILGGYLGAFHFLRQERELAAFLSSSAFIVGLLGATMAANYPVWLRSTLDPAYSLTVANTAASNYALRLALVWWAIGITLVVGYFVFVFRSMRGKVGHVAERNGY